MQMIAAMVLARGLFSIRQEEWRAVNRSNSVACKTTAKEESLCKKIG